MMTCQPQRDVKSLKPWRGKQQSSPSRWPKTWFLRPLLTPHQKSIRPSPLWSLSLKWCSGAEQPSPDPTSTRKLPPLLNSPFRPELHHTFSYRLVARLVAFLAFVPVTDVEEAFYEVTFYIQTNYPQLMVVVNYFEKTYLTNCTIWGGSHMHHIDMRTKVPSFLNLVRFLVF